MKKLALLTLLLILTTTFAFAQKSVPVCNGFDISGTPINTTTNSTLCTDYFGVANYANSPLPVGPIDPSAAGFLVTNGGSGYVAPTVTITDFYNTPRATPPASCTATVSATVITGVSCSDGGSGFMAPVVTIADTLGTGAVVSAKLASATAGGIHKFVDAVPDLKGAIAAADTTTFAAGPPSDYYEIALVETTWPMHTDLPPTTVRGYVQVPTGSTGCPTTFTYNYLGPVIVAQKNRPVRVKFTNCLPSATAVGNPGNLFIPADSTYMGAGKNPDGQPYLENRATLHLHGGNTPWISDGTPHQWTVPAADWQTPVTTPANPAADNLNRGVSTRMVPDMWFDAAGALIPACAGLTTCSVAGATTDPGNGSMTFFWTNEQGGRLMFYHDHAYGITRLNVYVGEAAGYYLIDPAAETALATATVPGTAADLGHLIPLVIQDKTFVPNTNQLAGEDPTWIWGTGAASGANGNGDLWFNHVYPTNQNPADLAGSNAFGRWDYGAWFFPPQTALSAAGPGPLGPNTAVTVPCTSAAFPGLVLAPTAANHYKEGCPIIPNPSGTPEGFMDTPLVNGKAYPVLHVAPAAYRVHFLSAGNDRALNLSLFQACGSAPANAAAVNCLAPGATGTEVPMVPAVLGGPGTAGYVYPDQLDGRTAGIPDSGASGPAFYQISTEGGLLPKVAVIPPTPVGFEYNRRSITVLNVSSHGLMLGPAERADVIVDFSAFPGKTLILYNDAPAPIPAFDPRIDYYTGDMDQVQMGGAPTTLPGYGPNTRTLMQIVVDPTNTNPNTVAFNAGTLAAGLPGIYATATAPAPAIVPEPTYPVASGGHSATATYGRISDNTMSFTPISAINAAPCTAPMYPDVLMPAGTPTCVNLDQKAIQELFTLDYGRMNATLGTELPLTNFLVQTTLPFGYAEWATEIIQDGHTQIWKLTHNGVDTHFIHFHLFNVQVLNRIGWDGAVKPPDPNELGWKDTVRMNPLEDIVFALQPYQQTLPWPLPDSIRPLDPTMPVGPPADQIISGIDPATGNAIPGGLGQINAAVNFGWEYVWHCHILGHEENDMMRPIIFQVAPPAPAVLTAIANVAGGVDVTWTDMSASETGFNLQRDIDPAFPAPVNLLTAASASVPNSAFGGTISYVDLTPPAGVVYYRVQAVDDFAPNSPLALPFQTVPLTSAWVGPVPFTANPIVGVTPAALNFGNQALLTTSGPLSAALSNTGTAVLVLDPAINPAYGIVITGANPGDFAITGNTCGTSVASGIACSISVTFTPQAVGARSAALTIVSNDPVNGTINVALTGVGVATTTAINAPAITYGSNGLVTVTVTSNVGTVTGNVTLGVDAAAVVTQPLVNGSATFDSTNTPALLLPAAGAHSLTATYAAQGAFPASSAAGTLSVGQAALTITASSGTMVYGAVPPVITPSFAGFVPGDTAANALTTQPTCSTTATSTTPVGSYPSTCTGAVASNYAITYVAGTVTVTAVPLTITASSGTMVYGSAPPAITLGFAGFLNGDTAATALTTQPTCSTTATSTSPVGNYPSTCTGAVATNYTITYVAGTVTVTAAPLTITATSSSKIYGQAVVFAGTEFIAAGLLNGNTVTNVTLSSAGAPATAPVASYLIVPSAAVGTGLTNYTIAYVNGSLAVTQAATVTTITSNLPSPSITGQIVTVRFSVAPQFTGTPTGNVTVRASTGESCTGALAAGAGSCNLTFSTGGPRTLTATYGGDTNFTGSASGTTNQMVSGLSLSTFSLLFGNQMVGTLSASQSVTLANVGTTTITGISFAWSPNFSDSNNCGTSLAPGRSCRVNVRFAPTTTGVLNGTLTITNSDPTSPQTVMLIGTGTSPNGGISPASLTFNSPLNVTSAVQTVTVTNGGSAPMVINSIADSGTNANQFTAATNQVGGCRTGTTNALAPGATCTINVTFRPTAAAPLTKTATLNVSLAAPATSLTVSLTGNVIVPAFTLLPAALNFGNFSVAAGNSPAQTFAVTNTGQAPLVISSVALGGTNGNQFNTTNGCPGTLAVGAPPCTITVMFNPSSAGLKSATVTVNVAAPATAQSVSLSGTGTLP